MMCTAVIQSWYCGGINNCCKVRL